METKQVNIDGFEKLVNFYLDNILESVVITEAELRQVCNQMSLAFPVSDDIIERTIRKFQEKNSVEMDMGEVLEKKHEPWLVNRKARDEFAFDYWDRYVKYLKNVKGWSSKVVASMDRISDKVTDLAGDPASPGRLKRRGLLIGDVQSGKTSNYIAIMNKTADVGYKVIILLTGTIESLRRQTQERVEYGFIGRSSKKFLNDRQATFRKGVGKRDINPKNKFAVSLTTEDNDFKSQTLQSANMSINNVAPLVLVMKKNYRIMQNLIDWLEKYNLDTNGLINSSVLLIDDEADNASINTGADNDPTKINKLIRKLLSLFSKSSYLAVTATPFANIFILPEKTSEMENDDLFPADYIYALNPPTNYIGNTEIFSDNGDYKEVINIIRDAEWFFPYRHKKEIVINDLPESLKEALRYFLLANVVLDIRGDEIKHRSMMVNVSRFVNVQAQIAELITEWQFKTVTAIQNYCMLSEEEACQNEILDSLRVDWHRLFEAAENTPWIDIQHNYLLSTVRPIEIFTINQKSTDKLDYSLYQEGLRVIAIGGQSLSRGLTLEGLIVSYFHRNSQAYDTLMQMGRWFGFKTGYDDLFKLWMPEDAVDWYYHITESSNELREEIADMNRRGALPSEFALRVRAHPTVLTITARNKMKHSERVQYWITLDGKFFETPRFLENITSIRSNISVTKNFIHQVRRTAGLPKPEGRHLLWKSVDLDLICEFLRKYNNHPGNVEANGESLENYIRREYRTFKWDVLVSGGRSQLTLDISDLKLPVTNRIMYSVNGILSTYGSKMRIGTMGLTKFGLELEEREEAEAAFRAKRKEKYIGKYGAQAKEKIAGISKLPVPDKEYLIEGRNPILILHIINPDFSEHPYDQPEEFVLHEDYFIGYGVGFPKLSSAEPIYAEYYVNAVKQKEFFDEELEDDIEEELEEGQIYNDF